MIALFAAHVQKKSEILDFVRQHVEFFRDPLTAEPHEPDVTALMRVCDVHSVPLATNRATAEAVVKTV